MIKIKSLLITIFLINIMIFQNNTVTKNFNDACSGWNTNLVFKTTDPILKNLKDRFISNFSELRTILIEFFQTFNVVIFLKNYSVLLPYLIPIGIIFLAVLISLILFFFNIFGCCHKKNKNNKSYRKWLIITLVLWIFVTAGLILFYFYLGNIIYSIKLLNCSFAKIPNDLLNGTNNNNSNNITFIGFNQLLNSFSSITQNFSQLQSVSSNFNNILGQNLQTKSQSVLNQYNNSNTSIFLETIFNPLTRINAQPWVISKFSTISNPLKIEIDSLNLISKSIDISARLVTTQFNNNNSNFAQLIDLATAQLKNFISQIENIFNNLNITSYDYIINIVIYVSLGICIWIILILVLNILISCFIKKKKSKSEILPRIFIFILSFLNFVISVSMIAIFFIFLIITVFCNAYTEFLNGQFAPVQNFLTKTDNTGLINNIFTNCVYNNGNGDLGNVINVNTTPQLYQVNRLIDGLTFIGNDFNRYGNISTSQSIPKIITELNKFRDQSLNEFTEIPVLLNQLNSLGCSRPITFNQSGCTSTCFIIATLSQTEFASQSACSSNQLQANNIFNRLKIYYNQDIAWLDRINRQLTLIQTQIDSIFSSFNAINNDINQIKQTLSSFIQSLSSFRNGIFNSLNCKLLNLNFKEIEVSLCINLNFYMFPFLLILIILPFFLCLINFSMFFLFKHSVKNENQVADFNKNKKINNKLNKKENDEIEEYVISNVISNVN